MKNKIVLFIAGCCVLLLSSCLNSDNNTGTVLAPNCQISAFSMANDSILGGLKNVKFTIDQRNGLIYNSDSLPYGTVFDEKVTCTISYVSSVAVSGMQMYPEATGDTINWSASDSVDFSKPVKIKVFAFDGVSNKEYTAFVNIHKVVPDSMAWSLFSEKLVGETIKEQKVVAYGSKDQEDYYMYVKPAAAGKGYQLYRSSTTDAKNWTESTLTGLPTESLLLSQLSEFNGKLYVPTTSGSVYASANGQDWSLLAGTPSVQTILGGIKKGEKEPAVLAAVVKENGALKFAAMGTDAQWITGDAVPSGFPLTGFASGEYAAMYHQYLITVAGRDKDNKLVNTTWGTMNGTQWIVLSDEGSIPFNAREGMMLTTYDNKFFLIGGIDGAGKASKEIYASTDFGVSWSVLDTLVTLPNEYVARGFSSIQVNKDNYMFIFGGKTSNNSNDLNQIWRGRINRLGFKNE